MTHTSTELPIPDHFDPVRVGEVWRVPYQQRSLDAQNWAQQHQLQPAVLDNRRICLLAIDVQNTFCIPEFELFVAGQSGRGAVMDNVRLCEFVYRNLGKITTIVPTMDTHTATQIFHPVFWVDAAGEHPAPMTMISPNQVQQGKWRVNPSVAATLAIALKQVEDFALHYVNRLSEDGKYPLTIWPYHSMLGGIGHALVSAFEEACFFHTIARQSQTQFEIKGNNPLTENYSVLRPEVLLDGFGRTIAEKNFALIQLLLTYDAVIVAGQAKSHCVAWTVDDLLTEIQAIDPALAEKVFLLEDCTSPVVVPEVVDFTEQAAAAYQRFAAAGMHVVRSTEAIDRWLKL